MKDEQILLKLRADEAQTVFDALGDAVLPMPERVIALQLYRKLEADGFITDELNGAGRTAHNRQPTASVRRRQEKK